MKQLSAGVETRTRRRRPCGWAGSIRFNESLWKQFQDFYNREDTFSLGICNGCQLMALLGFVPAEGGLGETSDEKQPRFIHNDSGRFESRWVTVGIDEKTPAVMLDGMQGSKIGVWIAHGEGKVKFPDADRRGRRLQRTFHKPRRSAASSLAADE